MASVAITVTLAVAGFLLGKSTASTDPVLVVGISVSALYISIQFVATVRAAVIGIERTGLMSLTAADVLRNKSEDQASYHRRRTELSLIRFEDLQESTNRSVTQMAIAHKALKNACGGILVAIIILGVAVVWRSAYDSEPDIEQKIINRIRGDAALAEFLRGPRGLLGQRGEKGERGSRGERGTKGDRGEKGEQGDRGPLF